MVYEIEVNGGRRGPWIVPEGTPRRWACATGAVRLRVGRDGELGNLPDDGGHDKRRIDRPAPDPLAGARPHAVRLPRWPLHAFVSDRDGNHEVYRMDADGSNVVRLTRTPEAEIHPFWSSDSRTIIYNRRVADERRYAIWTMGVDGANGIEVLRDDPLNSYAPSCPGPAVDRPAPGHYFVLQST